MSDKMTPIPFSSFLDWMFQEYTRNQTIFGLSRHKFFYKKNSDGIRIFDEYLETPLGPAAGPHTQLAQNIVVAYLVGGRFFELKTVQKLDRLRIDKPCIEAEDEGYNVEWSQELTLDQSYGEYVKAWFALHLLKSVFGFSESNERGFIFNMSVGYDLKGIQTERMDRFINELIDASQSDVFDRYRSVLLDKLAQPAFKRLLDKATNGQINDRYPQIIAATEQISARISGSVTLSTMHGCPPDEIEAISRYLLREKGLHTYVKLNPTLLGFDRVREILDQLGYGYMALDQAAFDHDLQYRDAVPMLRRLQQVAAEQGKTFGVKLSNTLGMKNVRKRLPGDEMYMSGRSLFPLTISLAHKLAAEFDGQLNISYSGGASIHNTKSILETGIVPVTLVTDLLKPGGYARLNQLVKQVEASGWQGQATRPRLDVERLSALSQSALTDRRYHKEWREIESIKIPDALPVVDCYVSPCREACPIHQDVAEYIRLVEEGRYLEAFEVIVATNPLPHITGYICDHQCMYHCTRWDYESPVYIREMKKVAAEKAYDQFLQKYDAQLIAPSNGIKAAVIGAGPAGLSAAYFLARKGFEVTVFDKRRKAGGVVQNVIPDFRLLQSAIDRDVEFVRRHGVHFQLGVAEHFSIAALKRQGFKYIFLGIGAGRARHLKLDQGEDRVLDALDFLQNFRQNGDYKLGKNVAVIGGGNSAMDAARAALRCEGVESVHIVYRRTRRYMPADKEEFDAAISEGVRFHELLLPVAFSGGRLTCQRMALGEPDSDGRRKVHPVEGAFQTLTIDTVISAIGEQVEREVLEKNGLRFDHQGRLVVDPATGETSVENVFIGGDALRGPSTVVESIADGKRAAEIIMRREQIEPDVLPDFRQKFDSQQRLTELRGRKGNIVPFNAQDHHQEAARCLACNFVCDKCVEVCPNRANVAIAVPGFHDSYQIIHMDALCNECGNCETFCPYSGAPYKEKITVFWTEADFLDSTNDGFYLMSRNGSFDFRARLSGTVGTVQLDRDGKVLKSTFKENSPEFNAFLQILKTVHGQHSYLMPESSS